MLTKLKSRRWRLLICLTLQNLDLPSQQFIFSHFALEQPPATHNLFSNTDEREHLGVARLVRVLARVAFFYLAFFSQDFQAEIDDADIDARIFDRRALGCISASLRYP